METNKTDRLLGVNRVKPMDGLSREVSPRFVNRRQNLYDAYTKNRAPLRPKSIGKTVLIHELDRQERVNPIDLNLPGGDTLGRYKLKVKTPRLPLVKKWALRFAITFTCLAIAGEGYVLTNEYQTVHRIAKNKLKTVTVVQTSAKHSTLKSTTSLSEAIKEKAPILILNGTATQGSAASMETSLKQSGFNITGAANAPTNNYSQTVIIDLAKNSYSNTELYLEQKFNTIAITYFPNSTIQTNGAAFVIILGSNETINS
jgi:hypothetical protein